MVTGRRIRGILQVAGLAALLALASPAGAWAKGDLDRLELVGPVRTVVTKHPQLKTTHHFDRAGNLTELWLTPFEGSGSARYLYLYGADGTLTEEQTYDAGGALVYRKVFGYSADERGRLSAQVAATENGAFAHAEFSLYDAKGMLSEELVVTGQGVAEKDLYDVRGNVVYHARYFQGRLVVEATHHHGPLGRLKESRFYGNDGEIMRIDRYRYDQAGNRLEQISDFFKQSRLRKSVVTYEFDQTGNWTKETVQRWSDKNGSVALTESLVSRERTIAYY
jgi:hypothetical protein